MHERMHDNRAGTHQPQRRAFTLIELLVVIFIMGILVTLVVSVSTYVMRKANREQTAANQQVILAAINAFHEITGDDPSDDPNHITNTDWLPLPSPQDAGVSGADYDAFLSGYTLQCFLLGAEAGSDQTKAKLQKATEKCLLELPEGVFVPKYGFRDAYGNWMRYDKDGGLGGRPVIISAGPDGRFETEADNIRSDGR